MPRAKKMTVTQFIDTRNKASVDAVEKAGYNRVPKTDAVRAEIRGEILKVASRERVVNGTNPASISHFMTVVFPPYFEAIEKYTKTIRIPAHQAMNVEENMSTSAHHEEHFITEEELKKIQEEIKEAVPQLTHAQAEAVAREAMAVPGDIDTDLESLLAGFSGLRMGGGGRRFSRALSALKRRKTTRHRKMTKKRKATRRR